jgi:toxin-antitoxin system PIN domain toxin
MLIDANLLLYAFDTSSALHERAREWLTQQLNGEMPVGIPWESVVAFVRISTDPRIASHPLTADDAWRVVEQWFAMPNVWAPMPTDRHADVLGGLLRKYRLTAKLVPDAHLAALAVEHGLEVCSADTDFARFSEITWRDPLAS